MDYDCEIVIDDDGNMMVIDRNDDELGIDELIGKIVLLLPCDYELHNTRYWRDYYKRWFNDHWGYIEYILINFVGKETNSFGSEIIYGEIVDIKR